MFSGVIAWLLERAEERLLALEHARPPARDQTAVRLVPVAEPSLSASFSSSVRMPSPSMSSGVAPVGVVSTVGVRVLVAVRVGQRHVAAVRVQPERVLLDQRHAVAVEVAAGVGAVEGVRVGALAGVGQRAGVQIERRLDLEGVGDAVAVRVELAGVGLEAGLGDVG